MMQHNGDNGDVRYAGLRSLLGGALIAGGMVVGTLGVATQAWALPKVEEVAAEVHAGHYDRAEVMMRDVLEAKPKSARAHYLYAEILAHNGRLDEARRHVDQAAELDPALSFTQPDKFKAFRARLNEPVSRPLATSPTSPAAMPQPPMQRMHPADTGSAHSSGGGIPSWVWVLGLAGLGYGLWRWTRRPQPQMVPFQTSPAMAGAGGNMGSTGWPGGMAGPAGGYAPQHTAPGSGISTGMAVAGGVVGGVALGMLAEHMMHGSSNATSATSNASATDQGHAAGASSGLSGGAEPGFFSPSGPGYAEPEIDFGTGNEWGDDGGGSGGDGAGGDGW